MPFGYITPYRRPAAAARRSDTPQHDAMPMGAPKELKHSRKRATARLIDDPAISVAVNR